MNEIVLPIVKKIINFVGYYLLSSQILPVLIFNFFLIMVSIINFNQGDVSVFFTPHFSHILKVLAPGSVDFEKGLLQSFFTLSLVFSLLLWIIDLIVLKIRGRKLDTRFTEVWIIGILTVINYTVAIVSSFSSNSASGSKSAIPVITIFLTMIVPFLLSYGVTKFFVKIIINWLDKLENSKIVIKKVL